MSQDPFDPLDPDASQAAAADLALARPRLPANPAPAGTSAAAEPRSALRWGVWLVAAVALGGAVSSTLLWQKFNNVQEELVRRNAEASTQAMEARTLARQANDSAVSLAAQLVLQEARLSEVSLQRTQLEELMQNLSRSRDENLVIDIESAVRLAQQQALFTGSPEPILAALKSAEQRLERAAQPRLNPVQRAIARDMDRLRAASLTDVPALLMKLDELARLSDDLPLANAVGLSRGTATPVAARDASAPNAPLAAAVPQAERANALDTALPWWSWQRIQQQLWPTRFFESLRQESRLLLRVSRIDQPEAALLSPEQSFFLRENLKLRLLNARLGLLSRQTEGVRSDLANASAWLAKYFDANSRKTQLASNLILQVQSQIKSNEMPRLEETLSALATAAAGR